MGTRQTGQLQFRVADLVHHQHLLADVQRCAEYILQRHPASARPLIQRWVGERTRYAGV